MIFFQYGYAPKGSSLILYRNKELRHYQYTITTDWPGGIYGSPTVNGSRAGSIIATCWTTLMHYGHDEYVKSTRKIIETTRYIERKYAFKDISGLIKNIIKIYTEFLKINCRLREMDGIFVFGTPATSVIALGSNDFHIYRLSEALSSKGWNLNTLQFPSGIHICVTHVHTKPGVADQFLKDVKTELEIIMETRSTPVEGKVRTAKLKFVILNRFTY